MKAYVLSDNGETWRVHFLWPITHRKDVVAQEVRKRVRSRRLGNLFHHPRDELTPTEIKRRLDWVFY
jgi:hypothetical protein